MLHTLFSPVSIIPPKLHTVFPVSIIPPVLHTQFSPVSIIPPLLHTLFSPVSIIPPMLHTLFSPVSIIPPMLHTRSCINHPGRYITYFKNQLCKQPASKNIRKSRIHVKILGARRVTWNMFHVEGPKIFGVAVQILVPPVTSYPGFLHPAYELAGVGRNGSTQACAHCLQACAHCL
jgi:hypothetical protein